MEAATNKVVSVIYVLRRDNANGEVVETLDIDRPLTFIFGQGNLLPKFEDNLSGRKVGDGFNFMLNCNDAYGPVQENAIVEIPIKIFEIDGKIDTNILSEGNVVPMMDREGRRLNGVIKKIALENVTMDFNHTLAGIDLFFKGEITDIREATKEELEHGHIHSDVDCEGCSGEDCQSKNSTHEGCGCDS
jgi:FKBP-type peptidyl-prolyl cis-trans isomerase SlyD